MRSVRKITSYWEWGESNKWKGEGELREGEGGREGLIKTDEKKEVREAGRKERDRSIREIGRTGDEGVAMKEMDRKGGRKREGEAE